MLDLPAGIYPMLYAFFDENDRLDREAMRRQVEAAVRSGAHGLAVLGLGTEVNKLTAHERRILLDWVTEDLAGRLPLSVTIAEPTITEAAASARAAREAGANFVILQPPPVRGVPEAEYIRFFGAVADRMDLPVAIQNAPDYIGIGLSVAGIATLAERHPNVCVIKAEGSALYVRDLIEATQGRLAVFNGRCGLELTDNLRAGCHGMIPGIESADVQAQIFDLMRQGTAEAEAQAEALYAKLLPMIVFMIQSIETFLCYGKRIAAHRLGLQTVHTRAPGLQPHATGVAWAERLSAHLGPLL